MPGQTSSSNVSGLAPAIRKTADKNFELGESWFEGIGFIEATRAGDRER